MRLLALASEPLVQLAAFGFVAFALHAALTPPDPHRVVVDDGVRVVLGEQFRELTGRAPTEAELQPQIDAWVEAEILAREARALGLDVGDPIVQRRLVQKMRFLLEERSPTGAVDDAALQAWIDEHADAYRLPDRLGFHHVFVRSAGSEPEAMKRAEAILAARRRGDDSDPGDAFVHGSRVSAADVATIRERFGAAFAQGLATIGDDWTIVRSDYGVHVVQVVQRVPGDVPALATIRERVLADVREHARARNLADGIAALRRRYEVVR